MRERFGRIDVLFANAGVISLAPLDSVTEDQFDSQFDINVKGLFFTVQKALPLLTDGASVILTSSVAHLKALEGHNVYAASKAAVRSFARSWAWDLRSRRIRVNCLSPGPVDTPIIQKMGIPEEKLTEFGGAIASPSHWLVWAGRKNLQAQPCSSPRTIAAISLASIYALMAVSPRYKRQRGRHCTPA